MGACLEQLTAAAPFAVEVRRESVYLTDTRVVNRDPDEIAAQSGMAVRFDDPDTHDLAHGGVRVWHDVVPGFLAALEQALAHPGVDLDPLPAGALGALAIWARGSLSDERPHAWPDGLVVEPGARFVAYGGHRGRPRKWWRCSTIEVMHTDLPALARGDADGLEFRAGSTR